MTFDPLYFSGPSGVGIRVRIRVRAFRFLLIKY